MSWSEFTVTSDALAGSMRIARETVRRRKLRGNKIGEAIDQAARALGISPRRTRSLLYGEVFAVAVAEYQHLVARFRADNDRIAAELRAEADRAEHAAEAERIAAFQLVLPFGSSPCSAKSAGASFSGDGGPR